MKKLIFLIVILALAAANAFAARIYPAEGRVVDEQGQAVEYATVVLLKGSDQVAGMATDDTRPLRAESAFGRVYPVGTIPRVRPRRAAGAGRGATTTWARS